MRIPALAMIVASGLALTACKDEGLAGPEVRPLDGGAAAGTCSLRVTRHLANPIVVSRNTTNHDAIWFINNTGTTTVTLNGVKATRSGAVTAARMTPWTNTVGPGERVDVDVFFDVGGPGTGTVAAVVSGSPCSPSPLTYNVTVQ